MRFISCLIIALMLMGGICYADAGDRPTEHVINRVWNTTKNALDVDLEPGTSIVHNQKSVATPGTAVQLTTDATAVISVTISTLPANAGNVYVGTAGVQSGNGFILSEDTVTSLTVDVDDVSDLYIDATTASDGVSWVGLVD